MNSVHHRSCLLSSFGKLSQPIASAVVKPPRRYLSSCRNLGLYLRDFQSVHDSTARGLSVVSVLLCRGAARENFFHACSGSIVRVWVMVRVYVRVRVQVRVRVEG